MDIDLEQGKLGELLVDRGVISEEELEQALEFQDNVGGKLGEVLVQLDLVTDEEVIEAVADQQNLEIVDLTELILPEDLINEIPQEIIEKHEVIPVGLRNDKLRLAIHDPFDLDSIEKVGLATDYHIEPVLAPRDSILQAINDLFYEEEEGQLQSEMEEVEQEDTISEERLEQQQQADREREELNLDEYDSTELIHAIANVLIENGVVTKHELNDALEEN